MMRPWLVPLALLGLMLSAAGGAYFLTKVGGPRVPMSEDTYIVGLPATGLAITVLIVGLVCLGFAVSRWVEANRGA